MDYKYFGDNLIPGVNAQNLNVGVVNPLMSAGSQVGQAYGDYGKNLRQALGQGNDQYAQDFLAGKLSGQPKKLSNLGSDYKESEAAAFRGAAEAGDPQTASIKAMTAQPSVPSVNTPSNADYMKARAKLTKDSTAEDRKKVEDMGMAIFAGANKDLAEKVKPGQAGYGAIQDALGLSTQDQRDAASDRMVMGANPEEAMASAKGNDLEIVIDGAGPETVNIKPQGQAFKDNAMTSILSTLQNENITPIVEGVELPDMSKYAGIFNQTNASDYKTMMENAAMGQLAENLGLSTKGYDTSNYFDRMFGK